MRFLVLGGGLQGSACVFDLLGQPDVESVVLADLQPERPRTVPPGEPRLELLELDFADEAQVRRAMEGRDVVLSAAPYAFNGDLARLAIGCGCDYSDLGGNTEIVFQQLAMADRAAEAGCTVIPDMGLAPGLTNVLAAAIRDLGLLSDEPIAVGDQAIVPRDVFIATATPHLVRPGEPDLVVLRVVAKGEREGKRTVLTWNLIDHEDPETGITAMGRCTGFTLSIVGLLIGRDVIDETGVLAPDVGIPYRPLLDELSTRGVRIALTETGG